MPGDFDDDVPSSRERHEEILDRIRDGAGSPKRTRRRVKLNPLLVFVLVVGLVIIVGRAVVVHREEQETERSIAETEREVAEQCDAIRDVMEGSLPDRRKAELLTELDVFEFGESSIVGSTMEELPECSEEMILQGQALVEHVRVLDSTPYPAQPSTTADVSDEAAEECSSLGAWVADTNDAGRFTNAEYEGWLDIVAQCWADQE